MGFNGHTGRLGHFDRPDKFEMLRWLVGSRNREPIHTGTPVALPRRGSALSWRFNSTSLRVLLARICA